MSFNFFDHRLLCFYSELRHLFFLYIREVWANVSFISYTQLALIVVLNLNIDNPNQAWVMGHLNAQVDCLYLFLKTCSYTCFEFSLRMKQTNKQFDNFLFVYSETSICVFFYKIAKSIIYTWQRLKICFDFWLAHVVQIGLHLTFMHFAKLYWVSSVS